MNRDEQHVIAWEHRQAELWDRIFQVTSDAVVLVEAMDNDTGGRVIQEELIKAAMGIGAELVHANGADTAKEFFVHLKLAKRKAVETDYWLRMAYVLQQREDIQRDLSNIISQYATVIDLLDTLSRHTKTEQNVVRKHTKGPRVF